MQIRGATALALTAALALLPAGCGVWDWLVGKDDEPITEPASEPAAGAARADAPNPAPAERPTEAARGSAGGDTYVVQAGDVGFWGVARKVYGAGRHYDWVRKHNPDVDPRRLRPGQVLNTPPLPTDLRTASGPAGSGGEAASASAGGEPTSLAALAGQEKPAQPAAGETSDADDTGLQIGFETDPPPADGGASRSGDPTTTGQPAERPAAAGDGPTPIGPPRVVAASVLQVNDRFISVEEVLRACRPELEALPVGRSELLWRRQAAEIISQEVSREVQNALVFAEADRRVPDMHKEQIDQEVAKIRRDMIATAGGSEQRLRQMLRERGRTLEDVLEQRRRAIIRQVYLQQKFTGAVEISRTMLWQYYRTHREEFHRPKRVQMQIIAAPTRAFLPAIGGAPTAEQERRARAEARAHIRQADERLRKGEDFGEVARAMSGGVKADEGGVWPMMERGSFRQTLLENAAFVLREGQVSDIIETPTGFYIVKARKVQPAREESFEDAQTAIRRTLHKREYRRLVNAYMKRLYDEATIVESKAFVKLALDRAVETVWKRSR